MKYIPLPPSDKSASNTTSPLALTIGSSKTVNVAPPDAGATSGDRDYGGVYACGAEQY
jgi:hypothetical protein